MKCQHNYNICRQSKMSSSQEEQNLLEGVMQTDSTSCPNVDSSELFTIDEFEGLSYTLADDEQEFKLSSNQSKDQKQILHQMEKETKPISMLPLTHSKRITSTNKKNPRIGQQPSLKKQVQSKFKDERKCQKIFELDSKLVEVHCKGILENVQDKTAKISQLVLTEEYCKLKTYQRSLEEKLKQISFTMSEYNNQKKALLNQISLLKNDNEVLRSTIQQLSQIIRELETSVQDHFSRMKNKESASKLPFTCETLPTYSLLSLEQESHFKKLINERISGVQKYIKMEDFSDFVNEIRNKTKSLLNKDDNFPGTHLYMPIIDKLEKDSEVRDWIIEISANIHQLETGNCLSTFTFGGSLLKEESQMSILPRFLDILELNKNKFAKEIEEASNKQAQFWFKVHSSITTFIGIIINENKKCSLHYSPDENFETLRLRFYEQMDYLKTLCSINLDEHKQGYWIRLWKMVEDVQELVTFRMLRSNT